MKVIWALSCFLVPTILFADDVTDAIDEALASYNQGDFSNAASQLDYASALVRQKKAEGITSVFCEPLSGWEANDASSNSAGSMMMGGGVTAERVYRKGNATVRINLVTDSPMLSSMLGMINNPALITMSGGKLVKVQGQKAMYKEEGDRITVTFVANGNALFTIEGDEASKDDVLAYGECLEFDVL